jgi:site-specific DNA-adenine methylase
MANKNKKEKPLRPPYTWMGGKRQMADRIWEAFGPTEKIFNYVEPFFGGGAVLLARPKSSDGSPSWEGNLETINDLDGFITNFWRATVADPETVAYYADTPIREADLFATRKWLHAQRTNLQDNLEQDIDYYDARAAGYWVQVISCWLGTPEDCFKMVESKESLRSRVPNCGDSSHGRGPGTESLRRKVPDCSTSANSRGTGTESLRRKVPDCGTSANCRGSGTESLRRRVPNCGDSANCRGTGTESLRRRVPKCGDCSNGRGNGTESLRRRVPDCNNSSNARGSGTESLRRTGLESKGLKNNGVLLEHILKLASRMRFVRAFCGDWDKRCGNGVIKTPSSKDRCACVFMDPPYISTKDHYQITEGEELVAVAAAKRAVELGKLERVKVVFTHDKCDEIDNILLPEGWRVIDTTRKGWSKSSQKEALYLSPNCDLLKEEIKHDIPELF